jgi:hypothetical protein
VLLLLKPGTNRPNLGRVGRPGVDSHGCNYAQRGCHPPLLALLPPLRAQTERNNTMADDLCFMAAHVSSEPGWVGALLTQGALGDM